MSLFSTLQVGASGLSVASTGLGVSADNIANVNTTGYKRGRASFADFMPQNVFGMSGSNQVGIGAATNKIVNMFGQGSIDTSGNSLDMAISGEGFFVVESDNAAFYTRNGEFYLDDDGFVVTPDGLNLQGHNATQGTLSSSVEDLLLADWYYLSSATSEITLDAQLSAEEATGTDLAGLDFFGTGTGTDTLTDAGDNADFSTSITVYDSLGVGHEVMVLFERSGSNDWIWRAVVDATEAFDSTSTAYSSTDGDAFEISSGTLTFDTSGALSTFTQTDTSGWTFEGAAAQTIEMDFGLDASGVETDGLVVLSGDESSVSTVNQDGIASGFLDTIDVEDDGTITGSFTNGETLTIGQVVLATFQAQQELRSVGGTYYAESTGSGEAAVDVAGSGSRGTVSGSALERSNVDLEDEFIGMITMQRSYQANAKTVSTADESLQVLMNMV